jgi:hypothetical protein
MLQIYVKKVNSVLKKNINSKNLSTRALLRDIEFLSV